MSVHNESGDACGTTRDGKAVNLIERVRNYVLQLVNVPSSRKINGIAQFNILIEKTCGMEYYYEMIG